MRIRYWIGAVIGIIFIPISIYFFILPPRVISISPSNQAQEVNLNSLLIIKFNKPVKRQALNHFIIPKAYGEWKFENPLIKNRLFRTLVFTPAIDFKPDTQYQVKIENMVSPIGIGLSNNFSFSFRTRAISVKKIPSAKNQLENDSKFQKLQSKIPPIAQPESKPEITLLNIPLDWQDYKLSCEAACLKMALAGKGVYISEDDIMKEIGYDPTPHRDGIWGDPYKGFVGNINGKICATGYGVYWTRVAKAANKWRGAESFSGWKLTDLTREIALGNPVIFWGTLPVKEIHDCSWHTPEGKYIKAVREDHVRVIVGFIGSVDNPLKIIINDPLAGRLYWSSSYFLTNWRVFGYSGVVIK